MSKKLIEVDAQAFDDLMYWLDRCAEKGHLENCGDLADPWAIFDAKGWRVVEPTQPAAGEPVYQWRVPDGERWWTTSKSDYEWILENHPNCQNRILWTVPPAAAHGDEAVRKDAERYRWLSQRDRFASVHTEFNNGGVYREHRVMWHVPGSWVEARGDVLDAVIDAAMRAQGEGGGA